MTAEWGVGGRVRAGLFLTLITIAALSTAASAQCAKAAGGAPASGGKETAKQAVPAEAVPEDIADVPSEDLRAGGNKDMRYFLVGPKAQAREPAEGHSLLVVMPGGDGSAGFNPFVRRILKFALSDDYIIAQPVAVKWVQKQPMTWPTKKCTVSGQKFSTEEFVEAVIEEAKAKHKVNAKRVFTLSWSSSGPAAYAIALQEKTAVTGSFVAMSVFNQQDYASLAPAKGRAFYIYHSPEDQVCPVWMARSARTSLSKEGATVKYVEYSVGHMWSSGSPFEDMRAGVDWLEDPKAEPITDGTTEAGPNATLPMSDSFETGGEAPEGWTKGPRVNTVEYIWDKEAASDGKASLCLSKTAKSFKLPIAEWTRAFDYDGASKRLAVSAKVKAAKVVKAIIDAQFIDGNGNWQHKWVAFIGAKTGADDPVDHDWQGYSGTVDIPRGTKVIKIGLQIYGPGKVWFDELKAEYAK